MTALATIADAGSHIDNLVFAGLLTLATWTYLTVQVALLVHRARTSRVIDDLRERLAQAETGACLLCETDLDPFLCPNCERRVQTAIQRYAR